MQQILFSRRAESDLVEIADYTLRAWGTAQARRYLSGMERCCRLIAGNPSLGREVNAIRPGLRAIAQGEHVIFYRNSEDGVLVSRILHKSMLPLHHLFD